MADFVNFITNKIKKQGLSTDYSPSIQHLIDKKVITSDMSPASAYTTFILHQSKTQPVFLAILKHRYLFDISLTIHPRDILDAFSTNNIPLGCNIKSFFAYYKLNSDTENKKDTVCDKEEKGTEEECLGNEDQKLFTVVQNTLMDIFIDRNEYIIVEKRSDDFFIGIKLNNKGFEPVKNEEIPAPLIPYFLLAKCFKNLTKLKFNEKLFFWKETGDVHQSIAEFMVHMKSLYLPLSISAHETMHASTNILPIYDIFIYMNASNKWPEDAEAVECVKTVMYCQYFLKSKYRRFLNKDYVVFKYNDYYFKIHVLGDKNKNIRYKIKTNLESIIADKGELLSRKIRIIKRMLGCLGFYPLIFDDFLIDCLSLYIGKNVIGDAKFIENFLSFDFNLDGKVLFLDNLRMDTNTIFSSGMAARQLKIVSGEISYFCALPNKSLIEELGLIITKIREDPSGLFIDSDLNLATLDLLRPDFSNYTFILSKNPSPDFFNKPDQFEEIIGALNSDFILGTPNLSDTIVKKLHEEALSYYSPIYDCLFVKVHSGFDTNLIANIMIMETSFNYIKFNK